VQSLESGHSEVLTEYLGAMARFHSGAGVRGQAEKERKESRARQKRHLNDNQIEGEAEGTVLSAVLLVGLAPAVSMPCRLGTALKLPLVGAYLSRS
jgi:hypothetical protein